MCARSWRRPARPPAPGPSRRVSCVELQSGLRPLDPSVNGARLVVCIVGARRHVAAVDSVTERVEGLLPAEPRDSRDCGLRRREQSPDPEAREPRPRRAPQAQPRRAPGQSRPTRRRAAPVCVRRGISREQGYIYARKNITTNQFFQMRSTASATARVPSRLSRYLAATLLTLVWTLEPMFLRF